jgi:polysaccharide export outer membrane protein
MKPLLASLLVLASAAFPAVAGDTNLRDVIKPGDILALAVLNEPDLSFEEQLVDQEGGVTIPLLGRIVVAGKSIQEANDEITAAFAKDYLVNPDVALSIATYGEYQTVKVLGEVAQPGFVSFAKGDWIDALRAIERAGGLARKDANRLVVKRPGTPDILASIGEIRAGKHSRITLRDGDTLLVGE